MNFDYTQTASRRLVRLNYLLGFIMPSLNFTVFVDKILSHEKTQTIRRERRQPIKKGDSLHIFAGLRTKNCKKLMVTKAIDVQKVHISKSQLHTDFMGHIAIDDRLLDNDEMDKLAATDGFDSLKDFTQFFNDHYGLPFDGVIIKWEPAA